MRYLFSLLLLLFFINSCDSSKEELIKTTFSELTPQEKALITNLDSNKTFYLYEGDQKYINVRFHSCQDGSCQKFYLLIEDKRYNIGINCTNLYIFYPNYTRKVAISQIDENNFILTNLKQQCKNAISTKKENSLSLSEGELPLCNNW